MTGRSHFLLENHGRWASSPGVIYNEDFVVGPVFHGNGLIFAFNLPFLDRFNVKLPPHVTFHKSIDKYNPHNCAEGHVTYYVDDGVRSSFFRKVHCPSHGGVMLKDNQQDVFTIDLLKEFGKSPIRDRNKVISDWGKDHVPFLVREAAQYMYYQLSPHPPMGGGAPHDEDKDGDEAGSDDEDRDDRDEDRDVGLYDGDDGKKYDKNGLDGEKDDRPDYGILYEFEQDEGKRTLLVSRDRGVLLNMSIEGVVAWLNQEDTQANQDTHADTQAAYPLAQTLDKLYSGTQRAAMVGAGARRKTGISAGTVVLGVFVVLSAFFAPVMGYTTSPK